MGCRLSGLWLGDGMGVSARDLGHLRKQEALRILASYEQPITLQIEGRRGRSLQYHQTLDCSTQTERLWEPLHSLSYGPANTPHGTYTERPYYSHMTLTADHGDRGRYEYLPNGPRNLEDTHTVPCHDPELSSRVPQGQSCLVGCCNTNLEEPSSFQSQTEDEEYMLEKTMGYLPLHHELDSGLGWTDGSFHQGELSGMETEEGLDECHAHRGGGGGGGGGGSPSSESFISSELSDSGFYSVSTGEFLRFQRLLEKRMRLYNARMHHQGEMCPRERRDSQKAHRELEAIPEALTVQPQKMCAPGMGVHPRGLFRVSSVQFRKAERPCLNRHSSSSGALFTPHATLSTCSTPSSQRRPLPHLSSSAGMLRRSRTLHHRPAHVEQRRRASHPASPNYCTMTLHQYSRSFHQELPEESEPDILYPANHLPHPANHLPHPANHPLHPANHTLHPPNHHTHSANHPTHLAHPVTHHPHHPHPPNHSTHSSHTSHPAHPTHATLPTHAMHHAHSILSANHKRPTHALSQPSLSSSIDDHHCALPQEPHDDENGGRTPSSLHHDRSFATEPPIGSERERVRERQGSRDREREARFHTLSHTPSQDANDTWPKPANRQGLSGGGGLYSTLEGHVTTTASAHAQKPSTGPSNSRVARNQLLRDRALRLADERSGMSTDEESHCEVRTGRYWSRTERREHMLQKQRQQHSRGGGASISGPSGEGGYNALLELSQKKLSRLRNRKLLDDWTTVEELLTHGTRMGTGDDTLQIPSSLLTVTTV